jgi:hypothetical protein
MPRWLSGSILIGSVSMVFGAVLWGCGSNNEQMICDDEGCRICDAYGCRPSGGTGGVAGSGGVGGGTGGDPAGAGGGVAGTGGGGSGGASVDADVPACDSSTTTCPCGPGDACDEGLACIDGLCLVACQFSSECGGGRICVNGKCVVGCDAMVPCPEGYTCGSLGVCDLDPGNPQCSDVDPCPGGLQCVGGVCQGGCVTNDECAPNEICNGATGTCIEDPQPTRPCAKDPSVCNVTQVCVDGYCRYPCTDGESCKLIDARIPVCEGGICMSVAEADPECTKQQDCGPGEDCVSNVCK